MKTVILKFHPGKAKKIADFLNTYHIETILSWSEAGFWENTVIAIVSPKAGGGITGEEKERLINENLSSYIVTEIN